MHKYIDADALQEKIQLRANEESSKTPRTAYKSGYCAGLIYAKWLSENLPAADVKPMRHGEWIEDDYGFFHCSECGFEWDESERTELYCPGCGARNGRVVIIDEV